MAAASFSAMPGSPSLAALFPLRVVVGVGELAVANNPQVTLSTYALGSCVAVVIYDPIIRSGGLLHLMLPDSAIAPAKAARQPAMFANTGLPALFDALMGIKVDRFRSRIFLAGGASVLDGPDTFRIGERNSEAVQTMLARRGARVSGHDLGGVTNRTIHLELSTGLLAIKHPAQTFHVSLGL